MNKTPTDKPIILVVDDIPDNIHILSGILNDDFKIKAATSGKKALKIASSLPKPHLILLDIMMPEMDGYEVCRRLKNNPVTSDIPVVFVTAKTDVIDEQKGFELGAVDYITKPVSPPIVKARIATHIDLYDQNLALSRKVRKRTEALAMSRLEIIRKLGRAAEYKDNETGMHVVRMSYYSKILAQQLDVDEEWVELLLQAAPMHDIGKIGIPDSILGKPGKLDADEWAIMQTHVNIGGDIIGDNDSTLLKLAQEIALYHHEKWDGSGYPHKLSGEDIPLSARIIAITDVFDALTSERPYKEAWSIEKAIELIQEQAGQHFDPNLVPVFISKLDEMLIIKGSFADEQDH
ncbi:response regulator [Vibrio lentus]|uniref:Two-component system response regulator n=1 Tax=Vibrio lentus TaxID=136468 RepID=A0A2N7BU63_9VIBR|nr:two-component system response regulator [Vibrio lentus]PME50557.1 two-component system response regulator [Vibrio lentus]PME63568.1 two-component system response regulator [Vibrio lentus]PME86564.1 two-component system response regulator [Vibrio lentus]PMI05143.1 two-component system response regulator [Vibrio lentus]PMI99655.1 two-component system response regulator [Vibrio lentus]